MIFFLIFFLINIFFFTLQLPLFTLFLFTFIIISVIYLIEDTYKFNKTNSLSIQI